MSILQRCCLFFFIIIFVSSCHPAPPQKEPPVAVNGVIDLKDWDFEKDGILDLKGEWKFKWMESRDEFAHPDFDDSDWDTFFVPDFWTNKGYQRFGYAWFRLKIINVKRDQFLAIFLLNALTNYKLYNNGKLILKNGKTGKTREESIPQRIPLYIPVENDSEYILAWHISNFNNVRSGPTSTPQIGLFKDIKLNVSLKDHIIFIMFGIITMMGIYHFLLWLFLKEDKTSLYFSFLCLVIAIRLVLFYKYLEQINPDLQIYEIMAKLEVFTVPCTLILLYIFYLKIFPLEFSQVIFKIFVIASVIFAVLFLILPLWLTNKCLDIYLIIVLLAGIWIIIVNILALKRKRPGSMIMLTGFMILFLAIIIEIIAMFLPKIFISATPIGMIGFLFSQSIIISRRFTKAYKTAKHLSENLQAEVKEQTKIIRKKNEKLINLNKEKTDYFINLAHETKTPLTLISNYLDKYMEEHGKNKDIAVIQENLNKLKADMINFLDYEKLVLGQVFYNHIQSVNFSYILESKIPLFISLGEHKNITFSTSIQDNIYIKADPSAIDRVATNIIDNAIKYTGEGGSIDISLKREEDNAVFCIKDTGTGIPEEQKKHIFNPYYQISHKKRNIQGMGMGLNIVKKIIDEIHGKIKVESESGKGTTFTIFLKTYHPIEGEEIVKDVDTVTIPLNQAKELPMGSEIIRGRYNIFIVEDNIDMLSYLQNSLSESYNIFYATNGKEALHKIEYIPLPHIIISDVMMDTMDGFEFYDELKVKMEYSFVPFLFLTALTSRDDRIKGIKKGAVDFISKPFNINELKAKIKSLIALQESQKIKIELEVEKRIVNAIRNRRKKDKLFYNFENRCSTHNITEREKEIIRMLLDGKEDKEVSSWLNVSYHTVRTHIKNIYKKCRVQNKVELVNLFKDE